MSTTSPIGSTPILEKLCQNPVVVDVECTTSNKGNAFDLNNKLVTIQLKEADNPPIVLTKDNFAHALPILNRASVVVGFNLKFDLNWLQRELGYTANCVWDCQLAEYIFSAQTWRYPDLNTTCDNYMVGHKLDRVAEYWAQGIDTDAIPLDVLTEYGAQDVELTSAVFKNQVVKFAGEYQQQFRLFRLHCNDLLVLQDMEFNGICYDTEASLNQSHSLDAQVRELERKLNEFTGGVPINFDSNDHISCLLYGGTIKEDTRLPIGVYKTGQKVGQTRYKIVEKQHVLPRLVEPLRNSELKKEGYFSTDESTLLSLKTNKTTKAIVTWLLERSKLMKLKSTYLDGLPNVITKHNWKPNMLHSNLNQCVAATGRLSSTKPNQQNLPKEAKRFCISRY